MLTAARTLALALFVLSLEVTPFAVAAPAQQNKMKASKTQADENILGGKGKGGDRKAFRRSVSPPSQKKRTRLSRKG